MRDAWRSKDMPQRHGPGPGDVRVTGAPSGGGFPFSFVFGLLILGGIGYAAWKYGPAVVAKFHVNTDAENAVEAFWRGIPAQTPSEVALQETVVGGNSDALTVHSAKKTRWYVAFGPSGGEEKPRVVRDDGYQADAHAFFDAVFTDAGVAATGVKHAPSPATLNVSWRTASMQFDTRPWRVVVGWSDKPTE